MSNSINTVNQYNNLPMGITGVFTVRVANILYRDKEAQQHKFIWQLEILQGPYIGKTFAKFSNLQNNGFTCLKNELLYMFKIQLNNVSELDNVIGHLLGRKLKVAVTEKDVDNNRYRSVVIKEVFPEEIQPTPDDLVLDIPKEVVAPAGDNLKETIELLTALLSQLTGQAIP